MRNLRLATLLVFTLLSLCTVGTGIAQESSNAATPKGISWFDELLLEDSVNVLELRLETDLKTLMKGKADEKYQAAVLKYKNKTGQEKTYTAEVRARGKTRKDICLHPPIKLKIKKSVLTGEGYLPHNEMKIVWECKPSGAFEQYIYKEYLAYRLYNLITPASFRAKLVKINLVDTNNPEKVTEKIGFIVEDEEQVAERLSTTLMTERPKDAKLFARAHFLNFVFYEYMIGNTDWAFGNSHNTRFFEHTSSKKVIPVPYDFDYSGLVNAPYAVPHESIPIKDVRERYFKGGAVAIPEGTILRKQFLDTKKAVMEFIDNFSHLDKFNKADVQEYIKAFYEEIGDERRFNRIINP
jgi:hypothetical protein